MGRNRITLGETMDATLFEIIGILLGWEIMKLLKGILERKSTNRELRKAVDTIKELESKGGNVPKVKDRDGGMSNYFG